MAPRPPCSGPIVHSCEGGASLYIELNAGIGTAEIWVDCYSKLVFTL